MTAMFQKCLAVAPTNRGDLFPPICNQPIDHSGRHRSARHVRMAGTVGQRYECQAWDEEGPVETVRA